MIEGRTTAVEFSVGGLWDGDTWEIRLNEKVPVFQRPPACPHCGPIVLSEHKRWDGSSFLREYVICPRVIVAYTEAGFATTGICADCVQDVLNKWKGNQ